MAEHSWACRDFDSNSKGQRFSIVVLIHLRAMGLLVGRQGFLENIGVDCHTIKVYIRTI